jgi:predicted RNase H-related nuclease YkuK (DUF458 family)
MFETMAAKTSVSAVYVLNLKIKIMAQKYNKDYFKHLKEKSAKTYDSVPSLNWGEMRDGKYVLDDRYHFIWKAESGKNRSLIPIDCDVQEYILKFQKDELEKLNKRARKTHGVGGNEVHGIDHRKLTIFIGTDSQNYLAYTRFVSVIVLYMERNGAHVLVSKFDLPKMYDYRYRLLREVDITAELARKMKPFCREHSIPFELHSDFNSSTNHKSNGVVSEATNYLKHLGLEHKIKAEAFAASYAADHFCK